MGNSKRGHCPKTKVQNSRPAWLPGCLWMEGLHGHHRLVNLSLFSLPWTFCFLLKQLFSLPAHPCPVPSFCLWPGCGVALVLCHHSRRGSILQECSTLVDGWVDPVQPSPALGGSPEELVSRGAREQKWEEKFRVVGRAKSCHESLPQSCMVITRQPREPVTKLEAAGGWEVKLLKGQMQSQRLSELGGKLSGPKRAGRSRARKALESCLRLKSTPSFGMHLKHLQVWSTRRVTESKLNKGQ